MAEPAYSLSVLRTELQACRLLSNEGCSELIRYRDGHAVPGACHPLLFQEVRHARVIIVGSVPGGIGTDTAKTNYQNLAAGQYSLGHKSAQGLGMIMRLAGKLKGLEISPMVEQLPTKPETQKAHLEARDALGLHVTNIVKCYAPTSWEQESDSQWPIAANDCATRFLKREIEIIDPEAVVLLGAVVARWFADHEKWGRTNYSIGEWTVRAGPLSCFGKSRFVTAWAHTGGTAFWARGRSQWPIYAEQLARFISRI